MTEDVRIITSGTRIKTQQLAEAARKGLEESSARKNLQRTFGFCGEQPNFM